MHVESIDRAKAVNSHLGCISPGSWGITCQAIPSFQVLNFSSSTSPHLQEQHPSSSSFPSHRSCQAPIRTEFSSRHGRSVEAPTARPVHQADPLKSHLPLPQTPDAHLPRRLSRPLRSTCQANPQCDLRTESCVAAGRDAAAAWHCQSRR